MPSPSPKTVHFDRKWIDTLSTKQMANFKEFKDLHDFNKPLNEDDWNNGQHFVFKLKNSMKNDKGKAVST